MTVNRNWGDQVAPNASVHTVPAKAAGTQPMSSQQVQAYWTAFADEMLAQVLLAVAGVIGPAASAFLGLTQWATALQTAAQNALSAANGAQTTATNAQGTANTANTNATTALGFWTSFLSGIGFSVSTATQAATFISNTWTQLTNGWNSFWNGIFGTSATGKTAADVQTAASSVSSTANTAATNAMSAFTNASAAQSAAASNATAHQGLVDALGAALGLGSSGNTVPGITAPLAAAIGSSNFRAYCTSAANKQLPGNGNNKFPVTLDITDYITSDYSWNSATNTLTVSNKGLYVVKVGIAVTGSQAPSGTNALAPLLWRNGSVARYGSGQYFHNYSSSANALPSTWIADSFMVELNAGDTVTPGVYLQTGYTGWNFFGESTGAETYFEVACVRRDN